MGTLAETFEEIGEIENENSRLHLTIKFINNYDTFVFKTKTKRNEKFYIKNYINIEYA